MSAFNFIYGEEELSHRAVTVYVYLRDRSNREGSCWPGVKTIARELKLSPRTVQRAMRDLEKANLVTRQSRYRENGSHTSNLYIIISSIRKREKMAHLSHQGISAPIRCHEAGVMMAFPEVPTLGELIQRRDKGVVVSEHQKKYQFNRLFKKY